MRKPFFRKAAEALQNRAPSAAAQRAGAPYQARIDRNTSRMNAENAVSNRLPFQKGRGFAQHVSNEKVLGESVEIGKRKQIAMNKAYRAQMRSNVKAGVLFGGAAILYPSTGQTGPNQGTFARRGIQNRRTVGVSSGSIQNLHATSMYNSIGGM